MEKQPVQHRLENDHFGLAEHLALHYVATIAINVTPEEIQDPAYWATVAPKLKPWTRIEARWEDGTKWAELLVLSCGRNWANVRVLRFERLASADIEQTSAKASEARTHAYHYAYRGQRAKHSLVRDDGEVMLEGFETKDELTMEAARRGWPVSVKQAEAVS
jgi:hypothetical protein